MPPGIAMRRSRERNLLFGIDLSRLNYVRCREALQLTPWQFSSQVAAGQNTRSSSVCNIWLFVVLGGLQAGEYLLEIVAVAQGIEILVALHEGGVAEAGGDGFLQPDHRPARLNGG